MREKTIYYELKSDPNGMNYGQDYFDDNGDISTIDLIPHHVLFHCRRSYVAATKQDVQNSWNTVSYFSTYFKRQ